MNQDKHSEESIDIVETFRLDILSSKIFLRNQEIGRGPSSWLMQDAHNSVADNGRGQDQWIRMPDTA